MLPTASIPIPFPTAPKPSPMAAVLWHEQVGFPSASVVLMATWSGGQSEVWHSMSSFESSSSSPVSPLISSSSSYQVTLPVSGLHSHWSRAKLNTPTCPSGHSMGMSPSVAKLSAGAAINECVNASWPKVMPHYWTYDYLMMTSVSILCVFKTSKPF